MLNISIVTYHTDLSELQLCLDSLRSELITNIFIVDNGAEKRIENFCTTLPKVKYIPNKNTGYGAGHNIAIRQSINLNIPFHLVINSDIFFDSEVIEKSLEYMKSHPECGLLHPRMLGTDGSDQFTARRLPTPFNLIIRRFLPSTWFRKSRDKYLLKDKDLTRILNVPYVQGSFMLLNCNAIREVGLFDENFFMYPEDIDLTRRIHARFTTVRHPEVTVTHAHRAASYKSMKMLWIHIVNMIRYFNKWGWFHDSERSRMNRDLDIAPYL